MWYGDKEISLRKLRPNRYRKNKKSVLNVKTRANLSFGHKSYMIAVIVLIPMVAAAFVLLAWLLVQRTFSENPMFTISRVRISGGKVLSEETVKEYTRIAEGANIFSFKMNRTRVEMLNRVKNIRNIEITRKLPDEVDIVITERVPLARLGDQGNLVADIDGSVFAVRAGLSELPVLSGYSGGKMVPGKRLQGMALPALELLDVIRYDLKDEIDVSVVNVDDAEKITLKLHDGRAVYISWRDMLEGGDAAKMDMFSKLGKVVRTLKSSTAETLDATFSDIIIGQSATTR